MTPEILEHIFDPFITTKEVAQERGSDCRSRCRHLEEGKARPRVSTCRPSSRSETWGRGHANEILEARKAA
jgi:hypothetical protein